MGKFRMQIRQELCLQLETLALFSDSPEALFSDSLFDLSGRAIEVICFLDLSLELKVSKIMHVFYFRLADIFYNEEKADS
ncbi:hypothetical protein ACJX0J_020455, partial [Zea mays]